MASDADTCNTYQIKRTLLEHAEADTGFTQLASIKLLYQADGYCLPTSQTLVAGIERNNKEPQVLFVINGHTPSVWIHRAGAQSYLAVTYFTGGNLQVLALFRKSKSGWVRLAGDQPASNRREITLNGERVEARNTQIQNGQQVTTSEHFKIQGWELVKLNE
ncbi:MAG: hypothetical protein D6758_08840 [Gammaproteobacteria bacterium]|nr:MAG: hypothetical protein D6758_08840 [Gammaproteobacteria bacterium]